MEPNQDPAKPPIQPPQPPLRPIPVPTIWQILKMSQQAKQSTLVVQHSQQPQTVSKVTQAPIPAPIPQLPPEPPPLQPTPPPNQPPIQPPQPLPRLVHVPKTQATVKPPQLHQQPTPAPAQPKQETELTPLQKRIMERIKVNAASKKKKKADYSCRHLYDRSCCRKLWRVVVLSKINSHRAQVHKYFKTVQGCHGRVECRRCIGICSAIL